MNIRRLVNKTIKRQLNPAKHFKKAGWSVIFDQVYHVFEYKRIDYVFEYNFKTGFIRLYRKDRPNEEPIMTDNIASTANLKTVDSCIKEFVKLSIKKLIDQ